MALLCAPAMLEEAAPQEMHPDEEDAVLRSLNRHLRGEDGETSDEGSSDSNNTLVNDDEVKPKPRVTAKKGSILRIYTDGSALRNGKPSAIAGVGVWFGDKDSRYPESPLTHPRPTPSSPLLTNTPSRNISEPLPGPRQTNQRAELTAILRAINVAPMHREVAIYTDSQYAINCVTVWHVNWSKNSWTTSLGKPVENQDLIIQTLEKLKERERYGSKTHFEWIQGHTGRNDGNSHGNSQADRLAVEGARIAEAMINRRY
ncbi:ribonuclease H-like domain-containing protein [Tuber borchii]|uniref:Ribonuclease H n=1 Tax=Tuber borchii TaxID=42251 RepID=A0A2T7A8C8_TUBBO|nr:ribonuclease H-like domain-containing protein [Tuber borchii]